MKSPAHPLRFESPAEWRAWLESHHATQNEAWLLLSKKGAQRPTISLDQAAEEALCFGWVDSTLKPVDNQAYALRFTPRKRGSNWALSNRLRLEKLIQEGRMTPAGLAKVAEAKESGDWAASIQREQVDPLPQDLETALREDERVYAAFQAQSLSIKRQQLYWINTAKRPETRLKRIRSVVEQLGAAHSSNPTL